TVARLAAEPAQAGTDTVPARHAAYFMGFAEQSGTGMTGPEQGVWAGRVERDYQNLRTALGWSLGRDDLDTAARLCLGLWRFWRNGSHIGEGRDWLDRVWFAAQAGSTL